MDEPSSDRQAPDDDEDPTGHHTAPDDDAVARDDLDGDRWERL